MRERTVRQGDRQTDRQTDRPTDRQTDYKPTELWSLRVYKTHGIKYSLRRGQKYESLRQWTNFKHKTSNKINIYKRQT